VRRGEIHALCGENGAGKSTLMNIIGGIYPATEGQIFFEGREVAPANPRAAQNIGIGFVHQELSLCPHLTVAENIFIGRIPNRLDIIDFKKLWRDADEILAQFSANFDSRRIVSSLTVSEQQLVEIAKSISQSCKLLILDEPTSSLTDKETAKLIEVVLDLKEKGISILYISHRMAEIFELCGRVTVFKDGRYIKTMNIDEINADDVILTMVGREINNLYPQKSSRVDADAELLKVEHLSGNGFTDISFSLRRGEILGFAGLVGAGRSEIMRGLCAIDPVSGGTVSVTGNEKKFRHYRDAVTNGICYLTEDRKRSGLFLGMSIRDNMISANMRAVSRGIWLDERKAKELVTNYVDRLNIKIVAVEYLISSLSGGNQQKCLVGKWLSIEPKVIIMDEPTRGIDVGAKAEIHNLLRGLAESGVGVIIVSSELPEVLGVSDRTAVIHEGRLAGILSGDAATEENIMMLASGRQLAQGE
jgi:ribose transport system ATP-binding protein